MSRFLHARILVAVGLVLATAAALVVWDGATPAQDKRATEAGLEQARGLSLAFRKAAHTILPSVVTIETEVKAREVDADEMPENPFKGTPFEDFFNDRDFPFRRLPRQIPRQEGMGSGVVIDASGIIVTNYHVVANADEVLVRFADGHQAKAKEVRTDRESDLAVVIIDPPTQLTAARWGDSAELEIGDWVLAVGNPFGLESTVSAGIISAKGRDPGFNQRKTYLQTDAEINPGNSGGPLVNLEGEVVGINTAIATNTGAFQGVGFAIPSNLAQWVVSQLVARGSVQRAWLGVGIQPVDAGLSKQLGIEPGRGVLIAEVRPGTPAAEAGLQEQDVVLEFAGVPVRKPRDLQEVVERSKPGERYRIKVLRDGKTLELTVVLKPLPSDLTATQGREQIDRSEPPGTGHVSEELGIEVGELTDAEARQLGYENHAGVLITKVRPNSPADLAGLREGMLIMRVGKRKVASVNEFVEAMKDQSVSKGVMLHIRTPNGSHFVVVQAD
ncbi:MAG: Do family serine endopeptidase [Pirellulales bacterium]|nr:Do family serine endopeptidase [Pirellulales bacterium]